MLIFRSRNYRAGSSLEKIAPALFFFPFVGFTYSCYGSDFCPILSGCRVPMLPGTVNYEIILTNLYLNILSFLEILIGILANP